MRYDIGVLPQYILTNACLFQYARRPLDTGSECLSKMSKEVCYGPIFACSVCCTLNFKNNVVDVNKVQALQSAEEKTRYLPENFKTRHPGLFQQLDSYWCCRHCLSALNAGSLPARAARNGLECTWTHTSPLGDRELQFASLDTVFFSVQGLKRGLAGPNQSVITKHMRIPMEEVHVAAWLDQLQGNATNFFNHSLDAAAAALLPAGRLRLKQVLSDLVVKHPTYRGLVADQTVALEALDQICSDFNTKNSKDGNDRLGETSVPQAAAEERGVTGDHFVVDGPSVNPVIHSVLLPDRISNVQLGYDPEVTTKADLVTRLGAAAFDPESRAGPEVERDVPFSESEWALRQLQHVMCRGGVADQPSLLFALVLRTHLTRLKSAAVNHASSLYKVPGTADYYLQIGRNLRAFDMWFGPPAFMITQSLNADKDNQMATWVSHTANLSGGQLQVWHYDTECEKLSLLAGRLGPASPKAEECKYYSHKKTQGDGEDSCPYHENCTRASLELYRDRSDFIYEKLGWPNNLPFRYRSALCSPSHLYTLSRVFARDTANVMKSVVMKESTGLNVCSFSQVNIKIRCWLTICFYLRLHYR